MSVIEASFNDFELYAKSASNWGLDFRLLSKNDFSAYLNMFSSVTFTLGRTKLHGKIEQQGLTPQGFRSVVIPVNYDNQYVWLNKKVNGSLLLIFPKDSVLDGISFNGFDVYVVSVEESLLFRMLHNFGYKHTEKLFKGDEKQLFLSRSFAREFHQLASNLLKTKTTNSIIQNTLIDNILHYLLKYIEKSNITPGFSPQRKRDWALKKAINNINNPFEPSPTVQQLCSLTGVSERTLEYAFLEKYKVSPSEYIKAYRLNMVKKELIMSKNKNTKISSLAAQYGFWHMGQFAYDFKKHFGILPSDLPIKQ